MKFNSKKQATGYIRLKGAWFDRHHKAVKSRYWSMEKDRHVECWVVVWIN